MMHSIFQTQKKMQIEKNAVKQGNGHFLSTENGKQLYLFHKLSMNLSMFGLYFKRDYNLIAYFFRILLTFFLLFFKRNER